MTTKHKDSLYDLLTYANEIGAAVVTSRPMECMQLAINNKFENIPGYFTHEDYFKKMKVLDKKNKYCIDSANILVDYLDNIFGYTIEL